MAKTLKPTLRQMQQISFAAMADRVHLTMLNAAVEADERGDAAEGSRLGAESKSWASMRDEAWMEVFGLNFKDFHTVAYGK